MAFGIHQYEFVTGTHVSSHPESPFHLLAILLPLCSGDSSEQFSLTVHHVTLSARPLAVTVEASTMQFLLPQLL